MLVIAFLTLCVAVIFVLANHDSFDLLSSSIWADWGAALGACGQMFGISFESLSGVILLFS